MKIGAREVGNNRPCLIVAELGLNHNGSVDKAIEMVRAAAKAGCEAVKAQVYTPAEFVGPDETHTYLERDGETYRRVTEKQIDLFARCALPLDGLVALSEECKRLDLLFGVTATDKGWIDALLPHVDFFKVGSDDLVLLPLLRTLAAIGKPVILSTGMASLQEILRAVAEFRSAADRVAALHCVSLYPTPLGSANVARMSTLSDVIPIGYSDHTTGLTAASIAIARGAAIVEKHFTLDKTLPGPDHWFSAEPGELASLCQWAKATVLVLGSGKIDPSPAEMEMRKVARRSIVAARDIEPGHTITANDLAFRRPGTGMSPGLVDELVGRPATRRVAAGAQIKPDDVDVSKVPMIVTLGHATPMAGSTSGYLH